MSVGNFYEEEKPLFFKNRNVFKERYELKNGTLSSRNGNCPFTVNSQIILKNVLI